MDAIKKLYSIYPKDDLKRLEKEVSNYLQANGSLQQKYGD